MDKLVKSSPFHGGDSEFEPRWEYKKKLKKITLDLFF